MSQLRALSAGRCAVTARFTGRVHSAFARACNIALDDGRLLSLLRAELGNVPHGVRLATPAGFAFDQVLRPGEPVGCRAGVLRFAEAGLRVRIAGAARWDAPLAGLGADLRRPAVLAAWRATRDTLARDAAARAPSGLPPGRVLALRRALRQRDLPGARGALAKLLGCGTGLTPAGDDVLVGLLAGMYASLGAGAARRMFLARLAREVRSAARATTAISRSYLRHAAGGAFAEPLAHLAMRIAAGAQGPPLESAVRSALAVGATSGAQCARGLLMGLACWNAADAAGAAEGDRDQAN